MLRHPVEIVQQVALRDRNTVIRRRSSACPFRKVARFAIDFDNQSLAQAKSKAG